MAKASNFARLKAEEAPAPPPRPVVVVSDAKPKQASRVGKKTIIFYDDPRAVRAVKQIGLDRDRTLQDLMQEAVDDLLVKYGGHPFGKR